MARRKRVSHSIESAETRAAGLVSINPSLDLGSGMTLAAFQARISSTKDLLNSYNTRLAEIDGLKNQLEQAESDLDEASSGMLAAVGAVYKKNSTEYEKAGGTRTNERRTAKAKSPAPIAAVTAN